MRYAFLAPLNDCVQLLVLILFGNLMKILGDCPENVPLTNPGRDGVGMLMGSSRDLPVIPRTNDPGRGEWDNGDSVGRIGISGVSC